MEPTWIQRDVVLAVHRRQLAEHGGLEGIRDNELLDVALATPRQRHADGADDVDLPALAAAYAFGIARNHPFVDGNKRSALVVCRTLLLLNGIGLSAAPEDRYRMFLALADGTLEEDSLAAWLREHAKHVE